MRAARQCEDCSERVGLKYARFCSACRSQHRRKNKKYELTIEVIEFLKQNYKGSPRMRGQAAGAASEKFHVPRWWVIREAQKLGLGYPMVGRRDWTSQEIVFLETHIGEWCVERLAREMKRSLNSVVLKIKRLHLSRRYGSGFFTLRDLETGLGADHRQIYKWIEKGWLKVQRDERIAGSSGKPFYKISVDTLQEFLWNHPTEFDLKKVDQVWFLALLGLCDPDKLRSAA
jgi:hypothetical protein